MYSCINRAALTALMFSLLVVIGCSDSSTGPTTPTIDIMPLKTGNHFIYNNYRLDSLTGIRDVGSLRVDSIVNGAASTQASRSCYGFETYTLGIKVSTDYFTKEASSIWSYSSLLPSGIATTDIIDIMLPQGNRWMKIADYASVQDSTWAMFDTTLTNISIPGVPLPVNAIISMKGKRTANETVTIGTKSYTNAHKFEISLIPTASLAGLSIPLGTVKKYMWIADSIGIIKEEFSPIDIQVNVPGLPATRFRSDGYVKELVSYKLQ